MRHRTASYNIKHHIVFCLLFTNNCFDIILLIVEKRQEGCNRTATNRRT